MADGTGEHRRNRRQRRCGRGRAVGSYVLLRDCGPRI